MNAKGFINYRREDTAPYAGRLYDRLTARFGEDHVFIDIDQIEPGEDFVEVINRKVSACDIAIVAIGPHWLSATNASGKRRLDDEEDFVRMEIVAALQRKIRVIPVLVGGARMPRREDLPEALAALSRRNAIELSETRFHADVNRLIGAIETSFAVGEKETELSATPVAPTKGPTTLVKSTQTTQAMPPVGSISAVAASKEPGVWRRKRLITVTAGGAAVILLFTITVLLMRPHPLVRQPAHVDQKGVDEEDAAAQNNLGVSYRNGEGVPKDSKKAAELFKKAADQGDAAAQNNLGVSYENGEGVPKDPVKAAECFQKAADQGYPKAQYNLGVYYASGKGVPKDSKKAAELFQKAADQGYVEADYELRFLSSAQIESLRSFELAFIDEFTVPGERFNATAFDARVDEGRAKFVQAIANERFAARRAVLVNLKEQFDADSAYLRSKASQGKVTAALPSEMRKDVNKIYDHALSR